MGRSAFATDKSLIYLTLVNFDVIWCQESVSNYGVRMVSDGLRKVLDGLK